MRIRRLIAVGALVTGFMIVGGVNGIYSEDASGNEISLEDVRQWAATDSVTVERLFEDLEDARQDLADAEDSKGESSNELARKMSYSYDINQAQLTLDEVLWAIDTSIESLDLEAVNLYFDLQHTEEQMGLQSLEINEMQLAYDEAVAKLDIGLGTQLNVDAASVDLRSAEAEMRQLSYSYESYILDLNQLVNRDLTDNYILEEASIPLVEGPLSLTSDMINKAIEDNKDLAFMYRELDLLEELEEIYEDLNDDDDYDDELSSTRLSIEQQVMSIEDEVRSIEVEIRTAYNELLTSIDNITISELALESKNIDLAMAKEKLDLGQVTETYVASLEKDIRSESLALQEGQLSYYKSIVEFEWLMKGY